MQKTRTDGNMALGLLFLILLFENALILYFSILGYQLPKIGGVIRYSLYPAIVSIGIVYYILNNRPKQRPSVVLYCFAVLLILLMQILLFPDNTDVMLKNIGTFLYCAFVCFWIGTQYHESIALGRYRFDDVLYRLSVIGLMVSILYSIYSIYTNRYETLGLNSDMATAYNVLICLCFITKRVFDKKTLLNILLFIIGAVYLLALGTRGAIICLLTFFIWSLFSKNPGKGKSRVAKLAAICIIVLVASYFYEQWLDNLGYIYNQLGFSTRMIDKITSGDLFVSNSRNIILDRIKASISDRPFTGNGIFSDRVIVGTYTHNIFYEIWLDFGYIAGTAIMIFLATLFFKAYRRLQTNDGKMLFMALFCSSVIHLLFSGSYLTEPFFFLLIGLSVAVVANKKEINTI